ncbi:MAG: BatD family protein [Campylobacterales bacterium]|nr:BatD family protein [Campylobacterales bacterium]
MKNLGKKLFILFVFQLTLFAQVQLKAPSTFYANEGVVFEIEATGSDVQFPAISSIENYAVQNAGSTSSTSIINGKRSQSISKRYVFYPTDDVTIPSFQINIDGKIESTQPVTVKKTVASQTKSQFYTMQISADKQNVHVGEQIILNLEFRYRQDLNIASLDFAPPKFDNFWVKQLANEKAKVQNDYVVQKLSWILFPQKSGALTIDPLKIIVNTIDSRYGSYSFFTSGATRSTPVYSNSLKFEVQPLPNSVNLYGDFTIQAQVDKTELKVGEALSLKVIVQGIGNMDDVPDFKLDLPNATIYENPMEKKFEIKDGLYQGKVEKTFSIVANESFTILPFELDFLNKNSQQLQKIATEQYTIKVVQESVNTPSVQTATNNKIETKKGLESLETQKSLQNSSCDCMGYFLFGMGAGVLLSIFVFVLRNIKSNKNDSKQPSAITKIQKASTSKELLKSLLVYINFDKQLDKIIYDLDSGTTNEKLSKIKKDTIQIIKDKKLDQQIF